MRVLLFLARKRFFLSDSDFVRLDGNFADASRDDVMTSSNQSASSIGEHFRFVPPLHRGQNPYREEGEPF